MLVIDYDLRTSLLGHAALKRRKPFFIAEAIVSVPLVDQLLRILKVQTGRITLALHVGPDSPILVGSFVMNQSCLFQRMIDDIQGAFYKTFLIRILYPKHEIPVLMLRDQIRIQRRP